MIYQDKIDKIRNFPRRKKIIIISTFIVILFLPLIVLLSISSQKQETQSQASRQTIDSLTTKILENNRKGNSLANQFILEQRNDIMQRLAYENPQMFLSKAMNQDIRNSFPENQKNLIEEQVELSGDLVPLYIENPKKGKIRYRYLLQASTNTYSLNFTKNLPPDISETANKINIKGFLLDGTIVLSNDNATFQQVASEDNSENKKKFLVLPVNFPNDKSRPYTVSEISNILFGNKNSVKKYYDDLSGQKLTITGDMKEWWEIPHFPAGQICRGFGLARSIFLTQRKYDLSAYDGIIFVFPRQKCEWAGTATIGGNPSYAWINYFDLDTLVHELGHNLGLDHANLQECTSLACSVYEYGDESDAMGLRLANMNSSHLRSLGFLEDYVVKDFSDKQINYTVYKLSGKSNPKVIKIDDPESEFDIYLEYRADNFYGYDRGVPYLLYDGVLIYRWNGNPHSGTRILDITPDDGDTYNLVFTDGEIIKLSSPKVTIKQVSHNENSARVEIKRY